MNSPWKALAGPLLAVLISACSGSFAGAHPTASPTVRIAGPGAPDSSPGASPAASAATSGARTGSSGAPGSSNVDSCVVGRWQSNAFNNAALGTATISGGAGVQMTITNSGDLTANYNGMQPVDIRFGSGSTGTGSLSGVAHAVITAKEGTITPSSYDGSGISVNAVLHGRDGIDTPVNLALGDALGPAVPENYNCSGGSMTLIRPAPLPNLTYQRQ